MKLSIVTACFNAHEDLVRTAASLPEQIPEWLEWIVIDGGSTDGSVPFAQSDKRISKFVSEADSGPYDAYNKGLHLSEGNHIWFLNCGDTASPGALSQLESGMKPEDDGVVYCYKVHMLAKYYIWAPRPEGLIREMSVPTPGVLFPRRSLLKAGGFEESFKVASDYEVLLKLLISNTRFQIMDLVLTEYKGYGISTNHRELASLEEAVIRIRNQVVSADVCIFELLRKHIFEIDLEKVPFKRWRFALKLAKRWLY